MRAVRSQQHGRAVCGQHPMGEKETFFGDFLPFSKKLPAPWSGSSGSKTSTSKAQSLDSRFRGNDERREKSWIPAFAGMTSEEREAGFPLRGNDERREKSWIPAFAGMTSEEREAGFPRKRE